MEWNSLRLLFSVSESEIVSTWWQSWGVSGGGETRDANPFQRERPATFDTPSQLADPAKTICLNKMRDSGISSSKVAHSGNHSPLASRDDGARKKDKGVG